MFGGENKGRIIQHLQPSPFFLQCAWDHRPQEEAAQLASQLTEPLNKFLALLSRTLQSWVGNNSSCKFCWVVAQRRYSLRELVWAWHCFDVVLRCLSYVSSSCDLSEYAQRSTRSWVTSTWADFCLDFRIIGGDRSGMSPDRCDLLWPIVPLYDHKRIWYLADGSLVGLTLVGLP